MTDIDNAILTIRTHLTAISETRDEQACLLLKSKLGHAMERANSIHKRITRGQNWQYYCGFCTFEREPNESGRLQCPECGEGLRILNLDKGERPIRRQLNISCVKV